MYLDYEEGIYIVENYKIMTIPRFILLDPYGKIVYSKAPNPSENITEILESLNL